MGVTPSIRENNLLARLPEDALDALRPNLAIEELGRRSLIGAAGSPLDRVVLPLGAVISLVGADRLGQRVEVALVGREGFLGVPLVLGDDRHSADAIVLVAGPAAVVPAPAFLAAVAASDELRAAVLRSAAAHLVLTAQGLVCGRLHELEARAARWILSARDRSGSDEFPVTHETLAMLLGVSRPKVTLASAALQRAGLVDNPRNRFRIIDRAGLEGVACGCYEIVRGEFERLLGVWARDGDGVPAATSS